MTQRNVITIWPFYDAPMRYQALSKHGGDEDLVATFKGDVDVLPWALSELFSFTRQADDEPSRDYLEHWGHIQRERLPDGTIVVICAHA